jgi:hypothetical protein
MSLSRSVDDKKLQRRCSANDGATLKDSWLFDSQSKEQMIRSAGEHLLSVVSREWALLH